MTRDEICTWAAWLALRIAMMTSGISHLRVMLTRASHPALRAAYARRIVDEELRLDELLDELYATLLQGATDD